MENKKLTAFMMCLLLLFILSACSSDYSTIMEKNWGIKLPKGYKETFFTDSGASFHGDGERYHVFGYSEELNQREIEKFSPEKDIIMESEVGKILNSLQVSDEKKPDFSKEYYWYKKNGDKDVRNKLYMIYFVQDKELYVIEDLY